MEHPCASVLSVGATICSLRLILPQMPRIITLSLQKNTTQSHKLQNDQGKTMIAKDSFVPLL